jgi:hypothetical protein
MKMCWATPIGGCGGGFTGEHILSKGLFTGKRVVVEGTSWRTSEPKAIGVNALTANRLCRDHNNGLSEVDAEGIAAFHAIRRFEDILAGRRPVRRPGDLSHDVRGPLLERWFIKHAINLVVVGEPDKSWYNGNKATQPPLDVVEAAFGRRPLQHPRGLYNFAGRRVGERKLVGDQVEFRSVYTPAGALVGGLFEFQALSFLIWLTDGTSGATSPPWEFVHDFYHHMGGFFDAPPHRAAFQVRW